MSDVRWTVRRGRAELEVKSVPLPRPIDPSFIDHRASVIRRAKPLEAGASVPHEGEDVPTSAGSWTIGSTGSPIVPR